MFTGWLSLNELQINDIKSYFKITFKRVLQVESMLDKLLYVHFIEV